jgi:hypothetical protein
MSLTGCVLSSRCDLFHCISCGQLHLAFANGYEGIAAARVDNKLVSLFIGRSNLRFACRALTPPKHAQMAQLLII